MYEIENEQLDHEVDEVDLGCLETEIYFEGTADYLDWERLTQEEARRNLIDSGITFDVLDEMAKDGSLPKYGTSQYRYLVEEAMSVVEAKVYQADEELGALVGRAVLMDRHVRLYQLWQRIQKHEGHDGPSDWYRTVFETIRTREHLYPDDWEPALFSVLVGWSRWFGHLGDPMVQRAVAWLEGDDDPEFRSSSLRDNGDMMVTFKGFTVIAHRAVFEGTSILDFDSGEWTQIAMKRGRAPWRAFHEAKVARMTRMSAWQGPIGEAAKRWLSVWGTPQAMKQLAKQYATV